MADDTERKQGNHLFKPGVSGNPAGRPLGARNKLSELFWKDFYTAWEELGPEALRRCAIENPKDFCKIAAMLMPKELQAEVVSISANLFADIKDFQQAYEIALEHIGVKRIEAQDLEPID